MSHDSDLGPLQEYQALREELRQSTRYVFERPLLILAVGVAGANALDGAYIALFPAVVSGLFLFNFWFTVNRLYSAARIVAYVQLELEERRHGAWAGWESSLRYYRKWIKKDPDEKKGRIDKELDSDAVPDALMYFPAIRRLHGAVVAVAAIAAMLLVLKDPTLFGGACSIGTLLFARDFARQCRKHNEAVMRSLIERNRIIWHYVFEYMTREGAKHHDEASSVASQQSPRSGRRTAEGDIERVS